MKTWARAPFQRLCGGPCGRPIYFGQPFLTFAIGTLKARHIRCAECAGEPVPKDLPALVETKRVEPIAMSSMRAVVTGSLPLDYKQKQSADGG